MAARIPFLEFGCRPDDSPVGIRGSNPKLTFADRPSHPSSTLHQHFPAKLPEPTGKAPMRELKIRPALPWLIGVSLAASLICLGLALYLGISVRTEAAQIATREMSLQADTLARQLERDLGQFDAALREASGQASRDNGSASPKASFPELPLTSQYLGFMNVLNEVGDVVADSRSNVSRPVNFAGRDYFQGHLKNPSDILMIGRPFATAPNQQASIPISRRLNRPDGSFAGVVVAGVHLAWLSDLLSHPLPGPPAPIAIRRDDGVILMRAPFDKDAIGRTEEADPAWQAFLRTGLASSTDASGGLHLFRRLGAPGLVLEFTLDRASIAASQWPWLIWLPLLALAPGVCVVAIALVAHRLLRRLVRTETAARAANDDHMRLLANMSHELRTPLTGILGQAELMNEEGGLGERQATRLVRLTEAGTLMRNIINRVINVAQPDDHSETPVREPCDLDQLARTCLGMVEGAARRKGLLLISTIDPNIPRRAMLARDLTQQVLINLLYNAVKFTAEGTISLRIAGDATRLWFEVADTGPGIPARKRRRLFHEYDRLDVPASAAEGTGLGLSIVERFVRRMGGRIGSIERKGGGSVFWVELPTPEHLIAATDSPNGEPETESRTAADDKRPASEVQRLCILLADDLDLTRNVTAAYLRSAGHLVTEVPDGETAIIELQRRNFDMVLTDMRMPVVDGLELTRRIRALPGHIGRTPVVLVTADLVALGIGESGGSGVDVCVRKPFTRSELLAAVGTAAYPIPMPDGAAFDGPVIDDAIFKELKGDLGEAAFETQLGAAARRIGDLLALLDRPDAPESTTVRDAVHDLIGVTGLMGFTALATCLRRFDTAREATSPVTALREAATEALRALHRRQESAVVPRT
jgi:signal transduction histidine kinase/CheY-like chemotaxis protein